MTASERPPIDFPSRVGVWWSSETWPTPDAQAVARDIEGLGFGSLFIPEVSGKECLTQSMALLSATERLVVGTGIANIHVRLPTAAESGARTLNALFPRRFILGLGVSHAPLVEHHLGGSYAKPLATMTDYLDRMSAVSTSIEPGADRPVRLLAALGPKMIELAGTHADGAHPYLVTPAQTATTRKILGTEKWIVSEQAVVVDGPADEQLDYARAHLQAYSALPNYRNSWLRQGFDESDITGGGSDRLVRGLVGLGSPDEAANAVRVHLDAGADHVVVQVLGPKPIVDPRPMLRTLSSALGL
ncbi:LLM class F420-dependent oxidoreductase [Mycolicibacterium moriokaense]|nr:LLM class F420-dependent oxidoreductase [Mycolicibacterium moriokaense]